MSRHFCSCYPLQAYTTIVPISAVLKWLLFVLRSARHSHSTAVAFPLLSFCSNEEDMDIKMLNGLLSAHQEFVGIQQQRDRLWAKCNHRNVKLRNLIM